MRSWRSRTISTFASPSSRELAAFLDEVVFVGEATVVLWVTDPAAPEPRPTKDVDVVAEVASRLAWHFEERLRAQGLRNDASSQVICRWVAGVGEDELLVDVMPSERPGTAAGAATIYVVTIWRTSSISSMGGRRSSGK